MWIIGCDMHTRFQQIAALNNETGELLERRLDHQAGEAQQFYQTLSGHVRVGIDASVGARWFEKLLADLGHELWVGNASEIRASVVRQQKTDSRDASHLLRLLVEGRFPRIWVPSVEERDVRQLLLHRCRLVRMRTAVRNQLSASARSHGLDRKRKLWNEEGRRHLNALPLDRWAAVRRQDLSSFLDSLDTRIAALSEEVKAEADPKANVPWSDARRISVYDEALASSRAIVASSSQRQGSTMNGPAKRKRRTALDTASARGCENLS